MACVACAGASSSGGSSSSADANDSSESSHGTHRRRSIRYIVAGCSGLGVTAIFAALSYFWLRARWNLWYDNAVVSTFINLDMDGNGTIDQKELYAGVLSIYLKLKAFVSLKVPRRESVMQLLEVTDHDKSGALDAEEFKYTMHLLSNQLLCRALVQLVLVLSCPLLASLLVKAVGGYVQQNQSSISASLTKWKEKLQNLLIGRALLAVVTPIGTQVQKIWSRLPDSFPATLVTIVMVNLINNWLYLLDDGLIHWAR